MEDKYITVSQLNKYIKYKFDNDSNLSSIYLKGEISNFKPHSRGHLYFTIKDDNSRISAVMFAGNASKLKFDLEDGMKVLVKGRISVYEATGSYQIYIDDLMVDGLGNLYLEYEKLKKELAEKGLFDKDKKKKIPKIPNRIGIITADTGAAIHDILSTLKRRWPITEAILFPSLVQGKDAAPDIVRQIKNAENYDLDVLIIGRGGGSIEDLWAFNEKEVAYAIYECSIPIISAVGHDVDYTIADFVADLRAPTPTGAAEMAVPNIDDFYNYLKQVNIRLNQSILKLINTNRERLDNLKNSYILKNPITIYEVKEQKFDNLYEKLINNIKLVLKDKKTIYINYLNKLEILNPVLTIKRGYTITKKDNKVINSIKDIKVGDTLTNQFVDGIVSTTINDINKN